MQNVLIVACEASADLHGANLVKHIKSKSADVDFSAIGATNLRKAGARIIFNSNNLSVMGFIEVLDKIPTFLKLFSLIKKHIIESDIKLVILIDSPDFNLRLAKKIKKLNPKTTIVYYIGPTIWAWRYSRVDIIRKYIDKILVIFPFEEDLYKKENIPVAFVGHPLIEELSHFSFTPKILDPLKEDFKIVICPGSRNFEVERLSKSIINAAKIIKKKFPKASFIVSKAPSINMGKLEKIFHDKTLFKISDKGSAELFQASDAAIIKSGTSTLEAGLVGIPMVIVYKFSFLSYLIAKYIIRIRKQFFGLVNILGEKQIVPELFQNEVTSKNISNEIINLLTNKKIYDNTSTSLVNLKNNILQKNTSPAKEILELL